MSTLKPDFRIVAKSEQFDVSRRMMATNCKLFDNDSFPGGRYETYIPAPRPIMQTFIDCVYSLVTDPKSVKSKLTMENFHWIGLLAEEFQCQPLLEAVTSFTEEHKQRQRDATLSNIQKLEDALKNQEGELASRIEAVLASTLDRTLRQLQRIPLSRIPLSSLLHILERALTENRDSINETLLCDFILAKVDEDKDACVLVDLLRIDRLPLQQAQKLFTHKKLQGWYFTQFPIHFVQELLTNVNSRLAAMEEQLAQRNTPSSPRGSPRQSPRRQRPELCDVETATESVPVSSGDTSELKEELETLKQDFYKHYHLPGFKVPRCPSLLQNYPFKGEPFKGMIAYLNERYGGNLHDKGVLEVTCSGRVNDDFHEKFVLDLEDKRADFCSRAVPGAWFCIDFKDRRFMPMRYSIRTFVFGAGSAHLKSWVIEISKTGEEWIEIDRRVNTEDLNGGFNEKTYEVDKVEDGEFRFIRLKMIGPNHSGTNDLICSAFEVFGALYE